MVKPKRSNNHSYLANHFFDNTIESQDLIANILRMEPRERLSIRQILGHDWFTRQPPVFSPSINDYFGHNGPDFLHSVIPEESASSSPHAVAPPTSIFQEPDSLHPSHAEEPSATESVASTASWHSAASNTTESDAGLSSHTARTDTPITSDDAEDNAGRTATDYMSASHSTPHANNLKRSDSSGIPRRSSQATITRSESRHSISHHIRPSPLFSAVDSPSQIHRFPTPSPGLGEHVPIPGSPSFHVQAHSRTPSRTKRRSVGSTMSERLVLHHEPALPDFVALLDSSSPQLFASASEKALLDSMALLGIDTGQMIHSVRNDACDSSSAMWWMLKYKADQREQVALEVGSHVPVRSESISSLTPSIHQIPKAIQDGTNGTTGTLAGLGLPPSSGPEVSITPSAEEAEDAMEILQYGEQNHSESPRKQRIQVPGSARASISAPLLVTRKDAKATVVQNNSSEDVNAFVPASPSRTTAGAGRKASSSRDVPKTTRSTSGTKPRSASVSTVSMLQRATTALGVRKERPEEKGIATPTGEAGRSTPSLLTAGFFARKVSSSNNTSERPAPEQHKSDRSDDSHSSEKAGVTGQNVSQASLPLGTADKKSPQNTPPLVSTPELFQRALPSSSPGGASITSRDTQGSLGSYSLPSASSDALRASTSGSHTGSVPGHSKPSRGSKGIFSTFKMWFNEEKRKSKQQPRPPSVVSLGHGPSRTSGGTMRKPYIHAPSPLQRPPIARMPSNTPSSAGLSRRNSSTSARRIMLNEHASPHLGYHHGRRRSDASRHSFSSANGVHTPTSERDHSRPPSAQSGAPVSLDTFNLSRKRHARAGSSSSAGSRHSTMITGSPIATYRRTPAVTQVRRISTPKNRYNHSRNASNNSSAHSASSRRSSLSVPHEGEETIMEEENEDLSESVELERHKALRKLSGDNETQSDAAQPLTTAAVAAVDAMSNGAAPPPMSRRRSSSNDPSTHRSHHRHSSVSSHHGSTVFAAHKVVNPFGTPNGSHFTSHSHGKHKRESEKPKIRDIFKNVGREGEDGWVDEDEVQYSGGFGQASRRPNLTPQTSSGTPTLSRTNTFAGASDAFGTPIQPMLGEGRYAGVNRLDCAAPSGLSGPRPRGTAKGPSFRQAATVVEEEEEEE